MTAKGPEQAKKTLSTLFLILAVALMLLPFLTTFNELLTRIVLRTELFRFIENLVVPYETVLVRGILSLWGVETVPGTVSIIKNGRVDNIFIAWNCVGWQSVIILLVSLKAGFSGNFTKISRLETLLLGVLGTFLINLFRIAAIIIVFFYFGKVPAMVIHDYSSVLITILWLFFFWWFSYKFVLEEKEVREADR